MRILLVGAGAIGGYFGGRLLAAGRDVTFLVRSKRAEMLKRTGLVIESPHGNVQIPDPPTVQAQALKQPYDLIVLSCKAYDLEGAIESFAPAVGSNTAILPLLNGLRHLEVLDAKFGPKAILGGLCFISVSLGAEGRISHFGPHQSLTFGERDGTRSVRSQEILQELAAGRFDVVRSDGIVQDMWEKWVFIASGAGITSLMRSSVGDYLNAGADSIALALVGECADIAAQSGHAPSEATLTRARAFLTQPGSDFVASMTRDIERGSRTEVEHILGDLLRRRTNTKTNGVSLLDVACAHVRTYEVRRARTSG